MLAGFASANRGDGFAVAGCVAISSPTSLPTSLSASWPVLIHFLQALQESDTPMAIDDLQIHSGSETPKNPDQQVFEAGFAVYAPATAEPQQAKEAAPGGGAPAETTPADSAPAETPPADAPSADTPPADAPPAEDTPPEDTQK